MHRSWRAVAGVFLAGALSGAAYAADEPARPWTNSADFGLILTSGNTKNFNLSLTDKFVYKWTNADVTVDAAVLRTENTTRQLVNDQASNTVDAQETTTTTAEMYGLGGKYTRTIKEGFFWYVNARWVSNKPAGIDNRYLAGGGVGYRFFKTEIQTLSVEFGASYTDETQTTGFSDSYAGLRAYLGYVRAISKTSSFTQDLEVLENLSETSDLRANSISAITANINKNLALKVSLALAYDNRPVVVDVPPTGAATQSAPFEYDKLDSILTAALVVNF